MFRRGFGLAAAAAMALSAAGAMQAAPNAGKTEAMNQHAKSLDAAKVTPKARASVEVAQRYSPWFARAMRLPRSKNPVEKPKRGKTNRRKAQLKAKRRRARKGR